MITVKIYKNTNKKAVDVVGVGEIAANSQVSIAAEQHFPVVLANYPGVIDISDGEPEVAEEKDES